MKCNVGTTDRMIRFFVGIIILFLGLYYSSWWGLIGFIPIISAILRFCPAYVPFGISTCKEKDMG
ncbi:MAG TPA: DUF2892 domain-containing protein [Syntrophales bacterium]|nr:DUF2892 domain-containing protein [Syntrophales bacterium]HOL59602.1 DUF2892 domain-containing protein [Syntrophales bacterium]HPO35692.1 DUF2892 domain-containing protein [Syntrophales bacterium]